MSKATLMKAALASWESTHNGQKAGEAEKARPHDSILSSLQQFFIRLFHTSMSIPWALQVSLCGSCPPIEKMDASLASLKACRWALKEFFRSPDERAFTLSVSRMPQSSCALRQSFSMTHKISMQQTLVKGFQIIMGTYFDRHLSLSTNNIEKVTNLAGLDNLEVLSLGRNVIKKLENLEPVSATLQELWISYNVLEKLVCFLPQQAASTCLMRSLVYSLARLPCSQKAFY